MNWTYMAYELCCSFSCFRSDLWNENATAEPIQKLLKDLVNEWNLVVVFLVNGSLRSFSCEWIWSRLFWAFCLFPSWAAELSCGGQRPVQATNTKLYKSTNKHSTTTQINIYKNTQILGWPRKYRGWGHVWTTKEKWCSQFLESSTTYHQQIIM